MIFASLLMCFIVTGCHYTHTQESDIDQQEHALTAENNAINSLEYSQSIKIKAVLLRLHTVNKTKAIQYASALALQLQNSNNPVDQELYRTLCQYIALAFQEQTAQQTQNENHDQHKNIQKQYCESSTDIAAPAA